MVVATGALAQAQVYRYTDADGRVVYTDRQPIGEVKNLQSKKVGSNFVSTSEPGLRGAARRGTFPGDALHVRLRRRVRERRSAAQQARRPVHHRQRGRAGGADELLQALPARCRRRRSSPSATSSLPRATTKGAGRRCWTRRATRRRLPTRKSAPSAARDSDASPPAPAQEGTRVVGRSHSRRRLPEVTSAGKRAVASGSGS